MVPTRELLKQELEKLNEKQLRQVADFIAFIKFRACRVSLPEDESQLMALYSEFDREDKQMGEPTGYVLLTGL